MSDIGLNASIYEQLRFYADIFDCSLVKLRSQDQAAAIRARIDIVKVLREMGSADLDKPGPRFIALMFQQEFTRILGNYENAFIGIADNIEKGKVSNEDIKILENIASLIDKQCIDAGSRMRGNI